MDKTLIALSILLITGNAHAEITAYEKNGIKVGVSSDVEVQAFQSRINTDPNNKFYNEDLTFRLDDGDLALNITANINDNLKAIGTTGFKYEDKKVENDDLFVGLKHEKLGTITIGRQATLVDDSGITNDIEFGLGFTGTDGTSTNLFSVTSGDQVAKYKFKNDNFWAGLSYSQIQDRKKDTDSSIKITDNKAVDIGAGVIIADASFNAYAQDVDFDQTSKKGSQKTYQLESTYKINSIKLGASYADSDIKLTSKKFDLSVINLTSAYTLGKTTFAIGADFGEIKSKSTSEKLNNYYANVTNKVTDNVKVYTEVGYLDADKLEKAAKLQGANLELGYVVGMEVKF
ncbi:porin [Vibrio sp. Vb339]|uniref:porin n=1 Tax=Vibrio sp. Vb339 TaxID=1192013 RepID=UPI001558052B|nr:porin [Vibrio sp. Vb339]